MRCWNQSYVKHCNNVPNAPVDQITVLSDLQKLSGGTSLVIAIIQICLLSSIMTLDKLIQNAAQLRFYWCLDVKEQILIVIFNSCILETCHYRELVAELLRLELNFTLPLEHVTELIVLGERKSSVAVDKFGVVGKNI